MAFTDTLTADIVATLNPRTITTEGSIEGNRFVAHQVKKRVTDGTSTDQATGYFGSTFTAVTGGTTISMADSADPLGAAGDDTPTSDPEGLKLRAIMIQNLDSTNFIRVKGGTNADINILTGSTDSINITAGGLFLWTSPAGVNSMSDGVDDEILVTADTASVSTKITYIYG